MGARIEYKASVADDLEGIDPSMRRRIVTKIERALRAEGESGKALGGEFAGLYRLRVRDYRVIYARMMDGYLILRVAHRENVYGKGRP